MGHIFFIHSADDHIQFLKYFLSKPISWSQRHPLSPGEECALSRFVLPATPPFPAPSCIALLVVLFPKGILLRTPSQSLCLSPGSTPRETCSCVCNPLAGSASEVLRVLDLVSAQ